MEIAHSHRHIAGEKGPRCRDQLPIILIENIVVIEIAMMKPIIVVEPSKFVKNIVQRVVSITR
jgi:hypothetical protein